MLKSRIKFWRSLVTLCVQSYKFKIKELCSKTSKFSRKNLAKNFNKGFSILLKKSDFLRMKVLRNTNNQITFSRIPTYSLSKVNWRFFMKTISPQMTMISSRDTPYSIWNRETNMGNKIYLELIELCLEFLLQAKILPYYISFAEMSSLM